LRPRQVLAPVVRKSSRRLLSELDFSSSIDTKPKVPRSAQTQQPSATELPPPHDEPEVPPITTQTPPAPPDIPPPAPPDIPPPAPSAPPVSPKVQPEVPAKAAAIDEFSFLAPVNVDVDASSAREVPSDATPPMTASPLQNPPTAQPNDDDAIFSQMGGIPRAARARPDRDKDREKRARRGKRNKPARKGFSIFGGKEAEEPAPKVVEAAADVVDDEVLDEISAKFGLEAKIDKIEAEMNAERKTTRRTFRGRETSREASESAASHKSAAHHFDIYGKPMTPRARAAWTSLVFVLGVALFIQTSFFFRHDIARQFPDMRPFFVSACETFGCAMPLPRDTTQIDIVDHVLVLQNDRPSHYILSATVSNSAPFAQEWPNIELTLFDLTRQPLVRRVITPAEWAPPEQLAKGGIAPRSDTPVRMDLEVVGVNPSNSRVELFYPGETRGEAQSSRRATPKASR
jgi:hypothetical protein